MPHSRVREKGRGERGSATLELVIIFPVVLLAFYAVLQAGLYYYARTVALAAAEEGARVASTETGSASAGRAAAASFANRAGSKWLLGQSVSGSRGAERATFTVTGTALSLVPGGNFSISQTASLPVERITG